MLLPVILREFEDRQKHTAPKHCLGSRQNLTPKLRSIPKNYNTILYLLNGSLFIEGEEIKAKTMVWFKNDGEKLSFEAEEASTFIILLESQLENLSCLRSIRNE